MSSKTKPVMVWALYTASLAALLTSFIAIILAYIWRSSDPEFKAVYDKQIRRFWIAGLGWALGLGLFVFGAFTDTAPIGSGMSGLAMFGVLIIVATQLWFAVSSLVSMIILLSSSDAGKTARQFA